MMPIWLPLWQLASVTNGAAILFIIVLLFTTLSFISRMRTSMNSASCVVVGPNPTEVELSYQSSPFQVTLLDPDTRCKQTLDSGIRVILSSQRSYWLMSLWGCEITAFHEAMTRDWKTLRQEVIEDSFLQSKCNDCSKAELCFETEKSVILKPSRPLAASDLGQPPRSLFPLVIVMVANQEEENSDPKPTDTVALICAIHVQDSICTSDSSFVFKLSKLANGQVLNVSHLFTRDEGDEATICLICESRRVTIGLLPCRHFSLCEVCYSLLESPKRCPVCRSYITRFFRHKMTENESNSVENNVETSAKGPDEEQSNSRKFNWIPGKFRRLFSH